MALIPVQRFTISLPPLPPPRTQKNKKIALEEEEEEGEGERRAVQAKHNFFAMAMMPAYATTTT